MVGRWEQKTFHFQARSYLRNIYGHFRNNHSFCFEVGIDCEFLVELSYGKYTANARPSIQRLD